MDILGISNELNKIATVQKISDEEYEIITGAQINNKTPIKIFLTESNGFLKFTDKKNTLKFMNELYELKSPDVTNCISSVIKLYGFTITSGELTALIRSEKTLFQTFYNFIICVGQLANMYAFFDKV